MRLNLIRIGIWFFKVKKLTLRDDKKFWLLYNKLENPDSVEKLILNIVDKGLVDEFISIVLEDTLWNKLLKKIGVKFSAIDITNDEFIKILDLFFTRNIKSINVLMSLLNILAVMFGQVKKLQ